MIVVYNSRILVFEYARKIWDTLHEVAIRSVGSFNAVESFYDGIETLGGRIPLLVARESAAKSMIGMRLVESLCA